MVEPCTRARFRRCRREDGDDGARPSSPAHARIFILPARPGNLCSACHSSKTSGSARSVIVLVIALIVIGPEELPDVGRSLGRDERIPPKSISGAAAGRGRRRVRHAPTPAQGPAGLATARRRNRRARARRSAQGMLRLIAQPRRRGRHRPPCAQCRQRRAALRDGPDGQYRAAGAESRRPGRTSARSTTPAPARTPCPRRPTSTSPASATPTARVPGTLYLIVGVEATRPTCELWSIVGGRRASRVELLVTDDSWLLVCPSVR